MGVPRNPKKALRAVSASNGAWIAVSDEDILATMGILGRSEGVFGEPAGVTASAGVMKAVQQGIIKPNETVTTISTGSGLKDVKNALRAAGRPHQVCAEHRSAGGFRHNISFAPPAGQGKSQARR